MFKRELSKYIVAGERCQGGRNQKSGSRNHPPASLLARSALSTALAGRREQARLRSVAGGETRN